MSGHRAAVFALAAGESPNIFYSADGEGFVVRWDRQQPEQGQALARVPSNVFSLYRLRSSDLLAVGSMSGVLYLISETQRQVVLPAIQLGGAIYALCQYDKYLLVGSADGCLSVFSLPDLTLQTQISIANNSIRAIALSPVLPFAAVACSDHRVYLIDLAKWHVFESLYGHALSVFSLAFSPDGSYLLTGGRDARLVVWDMKHNYRLLQTLPAHWFTINNIVFSPSACWFATASRDKSIKIWNANDFQLQKVIDNSKGLWQAHQKSVNSLLWLSEPNCLVSAGDDQKILGWTFD